jgi:hypothetical protein
MMASKKIEPWTSPAGRTYLFIGLLAATALSMTLMERNAGLWGIVPTLIAAAGLVFRWTNAPVFVLLGIAVALLVSQPFRFESRYIADVILALSVVTYVMAQYRLCSLTVAAFPTDPRRMLTRSTDPQRRRLPTIIEFLMVLTIVPYFIYLWRRRAIKVTEAPNLERRTVEELPGDEVPKALFAVATASTTALAVWLLTQSRPAPLRTRPEQWQLGAIVWMLITPVIVVATITSYYRWRNASTEEARLILADELWQQTRREQRRVSRWTAWARKKNEGKS